MFQENVFCFTPKGSVIKLPKDATPIDFAKSIGVASFGNLITDPFGVKQKTFS